MIAEDVELGEGVIVHHPELVNLYGCHIGDGTKIGAFVEIGRGVRIGRHVKIQSFAFIPEGVTVEDYAFIGPHVCFTNDKFPRAARPNGLPAHDSDWEIVPTIVRHHASIGASVTVLCGITIGANSLIGAGSVVTRDVPENTIVYGVPARATGEAPNVDSPGA